MLKQKTNETRNLSKEDQEFREYISPLMDMLDQRKKDLYAERGEKPLPLGKIKFVISEA